VRPAAAMAVAGAALAVLSARAPAQAPTLRQLLQQLARSSLTQAAPVANRAFSWAGLRFLLEDGQVALSAPVEGKVTAAVFTGHGVLQVLPPNAIERQQMERFTGRSQIAAGFTQAVFRFADATLFRQVLGQLRFGPLRSGHNAEAILDDRSQALAARGSPALARLLQAIEAEPASQLLLVELKLGDGHWLSAQFDPTQPEPLRVFAWTPIPDAAGPKYLDQYPDVWTQFAPSGPAPPPPRGGRAALPAGEIGAAPAKRSADLGPRGPQVDASKSGTRAAGALGPAPTNVPPRLDHYRLSLQLSGGLDLDAAARLQVIAGTGGERSLLLGLDRGLRLASLASAGAALHWLQPRHADWVLVRLPQPLAPGQSLALQFRYRGKAPLLRDQANGATSLPGWYPAPLALPGAPPPAPASFDLRFSVDRKYQLLATGERLALPQPAKSSLTNAWRSPAPLRAAGFAVGESQITARLLRLADGRSLPLQLAVPRRGDPDALTPLAGAKLTDILNFMATYFGPYPYPSIAATVSSAQPPEPLPMLVTLDPQAFLDATPDLTQLAPAASVAGQWWGAWTAPASVHDEWLIAGLQAASGLLYQQVRSGPDASLPLLRQWRQALLQPSRFSGHVPILAGPLTLGAARLGSHLDDGGQLLALKGAYILYMLRQMMLEPGHPDPDAAFIAMMRDFTARYGGRDVTSAQFQAVVERHMTPLMNLAGNHKMDWFFRPLLDGAAVPVLTFHAQSAPAAKGVAQVQLTVENPQHWRGLLPVYFFRDPHTWLRGIMPITQDRQSLTLPLPFVPQYVEANHFLDMLVEVRQ